jgi:hypothetical protein
MVSVRTVSRYLPRKPTRPDAIRALAHLLAQSSECHRGDGLLRRADVDVDHRMMRRPRTHPWGRRLLSAVAVRWTSLQDAIPIVKPTTTELDHIVAC